MIAQRMFAGLLLTGSVTSLAQYAPYPPAYPDPAYQQGYAPQSYYADGQSVASVDVFYEPLSRYGRWVESRWGRAFEPMVPQDWRPYTIGRWEDSPVYGRTWRSDEPFGWATYHYGRWGYDDRYGWVWVPDTVWGPGWVAWRDGGDYAGWAPLPPQVSVSFGLSLGSGFDSWDYDRWYEPSWVYVPRDYAYGRPVYNVILPYRRNHELWEHTRGVTHYDRDGDHIVNRSFDHDRGHDAWSNAHEHDQHGFADRGRDGHRGDEPHAGADRRPETRQGVGYPAAGQPAYGQSHDRQPTYGQPSYDQHAGYPSSYGRSAVPSVPANITTGSGGAAPPAVDPRAAYASRDRFSSNPNSANGGRRPDWEQRREQAFQPATGGNAPPPVNRGDRGRAESYAPPPVQNFDRTPSYERPHAATMAPPAAAFVRPAAPAVQVAPLAPRPAPAPRAEPQHNSRAENVKPQ